jgi:PAS domain S-box-containing protein
MNEPVAAENKNLMTVLVIEDDLVLNRLICKLLERDGIKTSHFLNGADAISNARTVSYDLILLDYFLPDLNAKQIILALQQEKIETPLIVMTGQGDESIAVDIMKLGARDYIIKGSDFVSKLPRIIKQTFEFIAKEKELKRTEEALRESERVKSELVMNLNEAQHIASIGSWEWNLKTNSVLWSDETYLIFGVTRQNYVPSFEANGKFIHPDEFELYGKAFEHSLQTGKPLNVDLRLITKDGTLKYCHASGEIIHDDSGQPFRFTGTLMDITKRKQGEMALSESEEKFSKAFQTSPYAITITRPDDGGFVETNNAFTSIAGYTREEALADSSIGLKLWVNEKDRQRVMADLRDGLPVTGHEYQFRTKSGKIITGLFSALVLKLRSGHCILSSINEITERKRAVEELRESKALVDAVIENVPLMIFLKEATDLRFVIFNRAGEELLGYDRTALLGKNNLDLFPPEQAAQFMTKDREVLDGETGMLDIPEEPILTAKKGQRLLHTRKVCIRGADGTTKYLLGITEDITERKRAEEKQKNLEEQLRQSQKLEAIGQLSSGVAHDFNNLLGGIMGHAELMKRDFPPETPMAQHAAIIITFCEKAADLTRQLLTFARKAPIEFRQIDLSAFIKQVGGLWERTFDRSIQTSIDIKAHSIFISGDRNQLESALLNLAINARDAMPGGGRLCITLDTKKVDSTTFAEALFEVKEGLYARISVTDTGTGMCKEIKDRIFEPFFTTKEVGKGTGLGLASVYGCVKQHNGYITVKSQVGEGTQFDLYFPIVASGPIAGAQEEGRLLPGKGSLLIIDDEAEFRSILTDMFESIGYTVHCCSNGIEAVKYFRINNSTIDVVILDMNMPKMSGLVCFRMLKEINSNVKVIVASGYGENEDRATMRTEGVSVFIQKPFRSEELAKKIAELIKG